MKYIDYDMKYMKYDAKQVTYNMIYEILYYMKYDITRLISIV